MTSERNHAVERSLQLVTTRYLLKTYFLLACDKDNSGTYLPYSSKTLKKSRGTVTVRK